MRVQDWGCGGGYVLQWLEKQGISPASYVGIDFTAESIAAAQTRYQARERARWLCGDVRTVALEPCDYVIGSGLMAYKVDDPTKPLSDGYEFVADVLARARGLAKKGFAFDFIADSPGLCPGSPFLGADAARVLVLAGAGASIRWSLPGEFVVRVRTSGN